VSKLIRDLKAGDVIPGVGVISAMDWYDDNRVTLTLAMPSRSSASLCRYVSANWDGDFPVSQMEA
jgi:hypothetical protein